MANAEPEIFTGRMTFLLSNLQNQSTEEVSSGAGGLVTVSHLRVTHEVTEQKYE